MDNYLHPSQFVKLKPENYLEIKGKINTCSDEFNIFLKLNNNIIENILFNGQGCSISTAALNLIGTYLIGMTKKEALLFINKYFMFVNGEKVDELKLDKLVVFANVHTHLNRKECALLGANYIKKILETK